MTAIVRRTLLKLRRYPTIAMSLIIIMFLIGISIYVMISLPLHEAVDLWNAPSKVWREVPLCAQPTWTNLFRREKLPETFFVSADDVTSTTEIVREGIRRETSVLTFLYETSRFPSEIAVTFDVEYYSKRPMLTLTWIKPDGAEIELHRGVIRGGDSRLDLDPLEFMAESQFSDASASLKALKGEYALRAELMVFEEDGFSFDAKILVYGGVYGIAGTDDQRRDLAIGLMWGTPFALVIGLLAAVGTTVFAFAVAAVGAWYGGWVDATIQRITEVSMMIPFLPTIMMVGRFYSQSIWVLLVFIIGFSLFSGPLKTYRAMFLQVKQSQYVEAARAYGASNVRTIFRYLIPRMIPVVLPRLILGVPLFVYLEASLAFLGISDPNLPTWGKILSEARVALYMGHYHWVLGPVFMLLFTGLAFSMLGYALDRVFNPRLRDI